MNRAQLIITLLLIFGALVIYRPVYPEGNMRAGIWDSKEKEFFKPIDVVWRGKIISTMAGGSCIGLEGEFNNYRQAMACFSDGHSGELWKFEGVVEVAGKWLGITCAYKNTIFGKCVPIVSIESIR